MKMCDTGPVPRSVVHSQESHGQHHVRGEEELLSRRFPRFPRRSDSPQELSTDCCLARLAGVHVYKTLVVVAAIRLVF